MHGVCVAKVGMHAAQLKMACKGMVGIGEQNSSSHQGSRGLVGGARGGEVLCGIVADGGSETVSGTRAGLFSTQRVNVSRRLRMKCKREKGEAPRAIRDISFLYNGTRVFEARAKRCSVMIYLEDLTTIPGCCKTPWSIAWAPGLAATPSSLRAGGGRVARPV